MGKKIGFIGAGNMSYAMISGFVKSKVIPVTDIWISNRTQPKIDNIRNEFGVNISLNNLEIANLVDFLIIAVKPNVFEQVAKEIADHIKNETVIISVAAGITINHLKTWFGKDKKIVRAMPNTPSLIGEGMTAICSNELVSITEIEGVRSMFASFGRAELVAESLFHAVIGASGSSPAYTFMFIEAMADATVAAGMSREQAYTFVAQAVMGAAKMVLESGLHPGVLKDMVTSPGGTTIEAVATLEKHGLRHAVIQGVNACVAKSKFMEDS